MSSGVFLTYFTIQYSMALTTFTYGLMFGVGIALAYAPPMGVAMAWYPRKKGLVNGIIVGGFGMGAFIFNTVQTTYLNPLNLSPREDGYFSADQTDILDRVPSVFLLLGSIYTVMQLLAVLLISSPGEEDLSSNIPLVTQIEEQEEDVLCSPSYRHGSVLRDEEQLQELRPGHDGLRRGGSSDRRPHAVPVPRHRVPRHVHHPGRLLLPRGGRHLPLPRLSLAEEDPGEAELQPHPPLMIGTCSI